MDKKSIVGIVVVCVVVAGLVVLKKPSAPNASLKTAPPGMVSAKTVVPPAKTAGAVATPVKKVIPKDRGLLTVKILDSKGKDLSAKIRAFKSVDARSSAYAAAFVSNKVQELLPGNYDIEVDVIPQKIYKNIAVREGNENVEDLGAVTGALTVKALNSKKKDANYPVKVLSQKTGAFMASTATNKPLEIIPGLYDLDIGTSPKQVKKEVRIEAGREVAIDLGVVAGSALVKVVDENAKPVRYAVKLVNAENSALTFGGTSNTSIELAQGTYALEVNSTPKEVRKDIKVVLGEETLIEVSVKTPPPPVAPAKPQRK